MTETEIVFAKQRFWHFCSNSYLGFASDPKIKSVVQQFNESFFSVGSHGSVEFNSFTEYHERLVGRLTKIYQCDNAILYGSAYMANISVLPAIIAPLDDVYLDASCHQSILDGCQLAGCSLHVFKHNDMSHLAELLSKQSKGRKVIVSEGVFSMEGDILNLPVMRQLADQYDALLVIDEACSLGQLGKNGFGVEEHFGLPNSIDVRIEH